VSTLGGVEAAPRDFVVGCNNGNRKTYTDLCGLSIIFSVVGKV